MLGDRKRLPRTRVEMLKCVAAETARMSYPGSMSRGIKPVVSGGTKEALEKYFVEQLPLDKVWNVPMSVATNFEAWHFTQVKQLALSIEQHVQSNNEPLSVAAKFLNTFMHQLTKYEEARPLVSVLHLPLDARVFKALCSIDSPSLKPLASIFRRSPYTLPYEDHLRVQQALLAYVKELDSRPDKEFDFRSRIALNWLWL